MRRSGAIRSTSTWSRSAGGGRPKQAAEHAYFRLKFAREDWTDGCIALADGEMAEIFASMREGTPILVRS